MKRTAILVSIIFLILLLPTAVTAVGNITVSSTPSGAMIYLDDSYKATTPATIESVESGTHTVVLTKSGYVNYTFSGISVSDNQTTPLSATLTAVASAPTISSITPAYGYNTSSVSITSLAGTGFVSGATIVLAKSGQTNISTSSSSFSSSTLMTCTFDITSKTAGTWNVILTNPDGQSATLTNGFEIRNPTNGTISFRSSPSGASVYINATKKGTTPFTLYDLTPGSYFIRMQKTDYLDYTSQIIVTSGNTTDAYASLTQADTYTTTATPTPYTTIPTPVKTTKKTTTKVPTPWPSATTQASPVGPLVILGALGLCFVILRKN
nr:PEGA domain-containing protein [uncultured Methanoregula sp.]